MTVSDPQIPELLAGLARGDSDAFDRLHAQYGGRVAAIARRSLGPRLRARLETADLMQEVWAAVAGEARAVPCTSERDFLRWIAAIVEFRALREARRWARERRQLDREVEWGEAGGRVDERAESPSRIALRAEAVRRVNAAVAQLPAEDREVVVLRHFLGLSWRNVATALGTSVEAAQMRCTRARRRLALLLQ